MDNLSIANSMFDVHKWFHYLVNYYGNPVIAIREWIKIDDAYKFEIINGDTSVLPIVEYCPICGKKLGENNTEC